MTFEENKKRTIDTFREIIIPKVMELGWFKVMPICTEMKTESPYVAMDYFGRDWYVIENNIMRGISARAQFGEKAVNRNSKLPWNTFTVRAEKINGAETELQKYKKAIEQGGDCPYWLIQAYLDLEHPIGQENILSIGMGKLSDVMKMIEDGFYKEIRVNEEDGTKFIPVDWDRMRLWVKPPYEVKVWIK